VSSLSDVDNNELEILEVVDLGYDTNSDVSVGMSVAKRKRTRKSNPRSLKRRGVYLMISMKKFVIKQLDIQGL
ncbi:hypothetical protein A2U01_0061589, partial [Trifolium medium]|nr:hypothetical protein [Trifolium medium]